MEPTECIYHEKQYGSMCGQHCLNNLLQAPYFQPDDLATIAHDLDDQERRLLGAQGGESTNMDDSGNFSIQVLKTALQRSHGLSLLQDTKALNEMLDELNKDDVSLEGTDVAFVCNLSNHWFAIRSIRGDVWDLNSLKKRPQKISLFYLSAYLGQLREEGYSIFIVRGQLPKPMEDMNIGRREDWFVLGIDDVNVEPAPQRASIHTEDPDEDALLQAALRESVRSSGSAPIFDEEDEFQAALHRSMHENAAHDEDADLKRALEMSLKHS